MKRILILLLLGIFLSSFAPLYAGGVKPRRLKEKEVKAMAGKLAKSANPLIEMSISLAKRIAELEQENAKLAAQNLQEREYQNKLFDRERRALFQALAYQDSPGNALTGTIIQVNRKGKKEIFGVIASHALQGVPYLEGSLGQGFQAVYVHDNVAHVIPAKVVQFSPSSMHDLALVKFPAEYEPLFDPIPLENFKLKLPAQGYSQGYACNLLSKQTFPIKGSTSIGMLTSHLPAAELGQRAGLCGSPVFTKNFHLAGIHIGSSYDTNVGYIAPVSAIKNLVRSYHSPKGIKPVSLKLAGREIGRLAVDEYVSRVELLDEHFNPLWKEDTQIKFSLTQAERELANYPKAAFIRLTVGHSFWEQGPKGSYILDDASNPRIIITPLK